MSYIGHRLDRLGVNKLLARAGATDGATVWIGQPLASIGYGRTSALLPNAVCTVCCSVKRAVKFSFGGTRGAHFKTEFDVELQDYRLN